MKHDYTLGMYSEIYDQEEQRKVIERGDMGLVTNMEAAPRVASEVLERIRTELAFGEAKKYLAVPIDIADLKALLAAVGGEP